MPVEKLTEANFRENLHTNFSITFAEKRVELELVEVKRYSKEEQKGMERFSIYFKGPAEPMLPQRTYPLEHEQMGTFDIFIVPISGDEKSVGYEAVFNYFK